VSYSKPRPRAAAVCQRCQAASRQSLSTRKRRPPRNRQRQNPTHLLPTSRRKALRLFKHPLVRGGAYRAIAKQRNGVPTRKGLTALQAPPKPTHVQARVTARVGRAASSTTTRQIQTAQQCARLLSRRVSQTRQYRRQGPLEAHLCPKMWSPRLST
jgi:hypothetical protein